MSDRPTPETDKFRECIILQYKKDDCTGAGMGHLLLALTSIEQMERQRDAYAETLRRVAAYNERMHHKATFAQLIRERHPELAGNEKSPDAGATESSALDLAIRFHETYERLAPEYGYETRLDTRAFDPASKNGELMLAVCAEIIEQNADGDGRREPAPPRQ